MTRRTLDQIITELTAAIAAGEIRNIDYKDIAEDANRSLDRNERDLPIGYHDEIKVLPNAEKLYDFTHLPMSVLHLAGWIKRASKHEGLHPAIDERIALAKQWAPVAELLIAARPLIVKGRKPRDPATIPARSDNLCSCCGRQIELVKRAADGADVIAHHGYERPGTGWQTSSCLGARFQPYHTEEGRDRLAWLISDVLEPWLAREQQRLAALNAGPATLSVERDERNAEGKVLYSRGRPCKVWIDITPDHKDFARELQLAIWNVEAQIRQIESTLKDQRKRLADWPGA